MIRSIRDGIKGGIGITVFFYIMASAYTAANYFTG